MFKKLLALAISATMLMGLGTTAFATESANSLSEPIIIGEIDGFLSDYIETDGITTRAIANVRINSYATYDETDGVQVTVKLYVPWYAFPKPEFTTMSGTVEVDMNFDTTSTYFIETANGDSTIESDVDTGVTGDSGDTGTVEVSGVATANNALAGGGAFYIDYDITLP